MNQDAVLFFSTVPKLIWSLFTSFKIPGLNFTPAVLIWGILSFRVLIWAMQNVFGLGMDSLSSMAPPPETTTTTNSLSWKDSLGRWHHSSVSHRVRKR